MLNDEFNLKPGESFLILGQTSKNEVFRPSDWAERLAGVMSFFGDGQLSYSPFVQPITCEGIRALLVDGQLEALEPMAYRFMLNFAKDNQLQVRQVCPTPTPASVDTHSSP